MVFIDTPLDAAHEAEAFRVEWPEALMFANFKVSVSHVAIVPFVTAIALPCFLVTKKFFDLFGRLIVAWTEAFVSCKPNGEGRCVGMAPTSVLCPKRWMERYCRLHYLHISLRYAKQV